MCKRKRAWLYCRIAEIDSFSMRMQVEELRRYAAERGYTIIGVTQEYGNGLSLDRYGLSEVVMAVENNHACIALVKGASRIARRTDHLLEFIRTLLEYGASLESIFGEV